VKASQTVGPESTVGNYLSETPSISPTFHISSDNSKVIAGAVGGIASLGIIAGVLIFRYLKIQRQVLARQQEALARALARQLEALAQALARQQEALAQALARQQEALARQQEALARQQEALARQQEAQDKAKIATPPVLD
jgi:uncharacterized protein HemX